MRRMVIILAAAVLCSAALVAEEAGLVLHYTFDGVSSSTIQDESGYGNDGDIFGGATQITGGFGSALEFNGTNGYVDCGEQSSLNIGKVGTIAFWFKPDTTCQGGLVGWAESAGDPSQRLVLALNTYLQNKGRGTEEHRELGIYMSDGGNSYTAHGTNFRKPYFPTADEWVFFAVTLDGRAVCQYKDGAMYYNKFMALNPNTANISLLIGKCFGKGGPSDYFKGLIDEVRIYNRPLSSSEIAELYINDAEGRGKDTSAFGSVGIEATAYPKQGIIFADLDYRGLAPVTADINLSAVLRDINDAEVAQAKIRMLPAWGRAEAVVDVSNLPAGSYNLYVTAATGNPATLAVAWPGRASGWENVKVLNNLCWELINISPGATPESEYTFNNPRRGWVYVLTVGEDTMSISLGGATPATVRVSGEGESQESMRWLPEGECTLSLVGVGELQSLIVRSVPTLTYDYHPHVGPGTGDDAVFLAQYVMSNVNTVVSGGKSSYTASWVNNRGGRWFQILYRPHYDSDDADEIYNYFVNQQGINDPLLHGVVLDEHDPGNDIQAWIPSHYPQYNEAFNRILEDPQYQRHMISPFVAYNMFDYEQSAGFCKNLVDQGNYLEWEVYLDERETEEQAWVYINDGLADRIPDWELACGNNVVPNMVVVLSYLHRERWNSVANYKVFMEMQYEHLATRPEFFGLAGIEEYASHYANEEIVRWQGKLNRHYGMEGNTERLSRDPYITGLIKNGDFIDGTDGWTLEPAEAGSISRENFPGLGYLQFRYPHWAFTDTFLLRTKRSQNRPNVFSQQINNLEPGQLYSVRFTTVDYTGLIAGAMSAENPELSVEFEGGVLFTDWYNEASLMTGPNVATYPGYRSHAGFNYDNRCQLKWHLYVFRATTETAKLTISDWTSKTDPGGGIGEELAFNQIEVEPYLDYYDYEPSDCPAAIAAGYRLYMDLNNDCYVNLPDIALFAENWLKCMVPDVSGCQTPWNPQ